MTRPDIEMAIAIKHDGTWRILGLTKSLQRADVITFLGSAFRRQGGPWRYVEAGA